MDFFDHNLLSVLIVSVIIFALGMFWFSPVFLGKQWMKESGLTNKDMEDGKKGMAWKMGLGFVSNVVMACILAKFAMLLGADSFTSGAAAGFWAWLGFVATIGTGMVTWGGKSWKLFGITMGYQLVAMLLMGGLLAIWA